MWHKHNWVEIHREQWEKGWHDYASGVRTFSGRFTRITTQCSVCKKYHQQELKGYINASKSS